MWTTRSFGQLVQQRLAARERVDDIGKRLEAWIVDFQRSREIRSHDRAVRGDRPTLAEQLLNFVLTVNDLANCELGSTHGRPS